MPGLITYGISKQGMNKLYLTAKDYSTNTDVIDIFLKRANLKFAKIDPNNKEEYFDNIRLTIDYPEDLNFLERFIKAYLTLKHLLKLLSLLRITILLNNWFRNKDFKENQKVLMKK